MTKKITFNKLTEEIIRESRHPFNVNDFAKNLENRWQKQISKSTLKNMKIIFARLRFSGPTFWEDTDRGNLNIYYSPHAVHLEHFGTMQQEFLEEARAEEAAIKGVG